MTAFPGIMQNIMVSHEKIPQNARGRAYAVAQAGVTLF
jgi:hypothetical protein